MKDIVIKKIDKKDEVEKAMELAWNVFLQFEACDYGEEGTQEFYQSIHNEEYLQLLIVYAAYHNDTMIGMLATRLQGSHIAQFFVEEKLHRQGIGRKLLAVAIHDNPSSFMSVYAAPYATTIYHKLGFYDTDVEQEENGIRYTPMKLDLPK